MPSDDHRIAPRDIPLPIQREIRQRCGFGCVVCGLPLYEYDHLLGFADVQEHIAKDITLLCDKHHREVTSGLLPREDVVAADKNPYNHRGSGATPLDLHFSGTECEVIIGTNRFTTADTGYGTEMVPLVIDGVPILGFLLTDGHLLFNLNLFDENNDLVLQIVNNALAVSVDAWDIEFVGRRLKVRQELRNFLLDITFEVPNQVTVNRGRLMRNGVEVLVTPEYALVTNNSMLISRSTATNVGAGLVLGPGELRAGCMFRMAAIPRYLGDRGASKKWAEEQMKG